MGSFAEGSFYFMCGVLCLGIAVLIGIGCGCVIFTFIQYIKEEKEDWKRRRY